MPGHPRALRLPLPGHPRRPDTLLRAPQHPFSARRRHGGAPGPASVTQKRRRSGRRSALALVRGREGGGGVRDGAVRAALPLRVRRRGAWEQGGGAQDEGVRGGRGRRVGLGGGGVRRDGGDDQGRGEAVRAVRVGEV